MSKVAIIDGDEVAFRVSAACETRSIKAVLKSDDKISFEAKHRTEFKELLQNPLFNDKEYSFDDFIIVDLQKAEPIDFVLGTCKAAIKNILEKTGCETYEIYLSGKDNFRDNLPLPKRYKSGRDGNVRPLRLQEVRDYLVKHHKAETVNGYEADDKLAMRGVDPNTIVISQDKDALGVQGITVYNPVKEVFHFISGLGRLFINDKGDVKGEGFKWLCYQWVLGDKVDTFCPYDLAFKDGKKIRFGEKAAYKLLEPCTTYKECLQVVHDLYKSWYPEPISYIAWDCQPYTKSYIEMMQLYLDCCRMLRSEDDYVKVEDVLNKFEINY